MRLQVPPSEWRRQLAALLTLLRAIGHVVHKVDAQNDPKLRPAVEAWWTALNADKASHPLFWEFIERERNSFIKEYETAARQVVVGHVGLVRYDSATDSYSSGPYVPPKYTPKLAAGHFSGRDLQQAAAEAIEWWELQLSNIDAARSSAA